MHLEFKSIRLRAAASVALRSLEQTIKAQTKSLPQQKQEECPGGNGIPQADDPGLGEVADTPDTCSATGRNLSRLADSRPAGWTRKCLEMLANFCDCVTPWPTTGVGLPRAQHTSGGHFPEGQTSCRKQQSGNPVMQDGEHWGYSAGSHNQPTPGPGMPRVCKHSTLCLCTHSNELSAYSNIKLPIKGRQKQLHPKAKSSLCITLGFY